MPEFLLRIARKAAASFNFHVSQIGLRILLAVPLNLLPKSPTRISYASSYLVENTMHRSITVHVDRRILGSSTGDPDSSRDDPESLFSCGHVVFDDDTLYRFGDLFHQISSFQ